MTRRHRTHAALRRALTGLVVDSLAVRQDVARGTVRCAACARAGSNPDLATGDVVCVVLREYEGFTWEIQDISCLDHRADSVVDAAGLEADDQVLVRARLEAAGYHAPDGQYHPDALTLGGVDVLDYSPAADGYDR